MSSTKTSPPLAMIEVFITKLTASFIVIKNLVTFLSVNVTGPPDFIWFRNFGTTEPEDPNTFPNRTIENLVNLDLFWKAWIISSDNLFEAPIILVGLTALSLLISIKLDILYFNDKSAKINVPKTLFFIPTIGFSSTILTCLYAAAWKTMSGLCFLKIISKFFLSNTEAKIGITFKRLLNILFSISSSMEYKKNSFSSTIIIHAGDNWDICLQISFPIDPPPPVTKIFLLFMCEFIDKDWMWIGDLPSKSLRFKSIILEIFIFPDVNSFKLGKVRTAIFKNWMLDSNLIFLWRPNELIASKTNWTLYFFLIVFNLDGWNITLLLILVPCNKRLSSKNPMKLIFSSALITFANCLPVDPAP